MNIFILSNETTWAKHLDEQVQYMCDRHIVKMVAESVQMLATALHTGMPVLNTIPLSSTPLTPITKLRDSTPCKPLTGGMTKHPCTRWVMASPHNFNYLAVLALAMCYEHQHRWPLNPQHAYMPWLVSVVDVVSEHGFGLWTRMPTLYAVAVKDKEKSTIHAPQHHAVYEYRNYYVHDKHRFATWKRRVKPVWFLLREEELTAQGRL